MKIRLNFRLGSLVLMFMLSACLSIEIGSQYAVSVQGQTTFTAGINNIALGFSSFQKGFYLQNSATTLTSCTFNCEFPLQCSLGLWGGSLYLNKNLVFSNPTLFLMTGNIYGQNNALEFAKSSAQQVIPNDSSYYASTSTVVANSYSTTANSLHWAYDAQQLAIATPTELAVAFAPSVFTTSTVFATQGASVSVNCVRWYPSDYYLAAGVSTGAGNELYIFYANVSVQTLTSITSGFAGASGDNLYALAWNNNGSYIAIGKVAAPEVILYSFSTGAGTLTQQATASLPVSSDQVSNNAMAFSPQSTYLAVGTSRASAGATVLIYNTAGGTLTLNASIDPGFAALSVDYSSTGSYVAVGLSGATNNVQIYQHNPVAGTLTLITSASLGGSSFPGNTVKWNHQGNYLMVGTNTTGYFIYYFDPCSQFLYPQSTNTSAISVNDCAWTNDGNYIALCESTGAIPYQINQIFYNQSFLYFDSSTLVFNSPMMLGTTWKFNGPCKISGKENILTISPGTQIQLYPNSSLVLQDLTIVGLNGYNLQCLADNASITFRNCVLKMESNYTVSLGTLNFYEDVLISGTGMFSYVGDQPITIASGAMLVFDSGMTFSYSPSSANTGLLTFADQTATMYLNNCTLYSTITGLNLQTGSLIIDNNVTMTTEARNTGEAPILGSSLQITFQGGAFLNMFGFYKYV